MEMGSGEIEKGEIEKGEIEKETLNRNSEEKLLILFSSAHSYFYIIVLVL